MKITVNQYAQTLFELTQKKKEEEIDKVISDFFKMVRKNRQLKQLPKIIEVFSLIWNDKKKIVEAEVTSAQELSLETKSKIERYLQKKYGAEKVVIKSKLDKNIIGGITLRVKDEVFNYSIKETLKKLNRELIK